MTVTNAPAVALACSEGGGVRKKRYALVVAAPSIPGEPHLPSCNVSAELLAATLEAHGWEPPFMRETGRPRLSMLGEKDMVDAFVDMDYSMQLQPAACSFCFSGHGTEWKGVQKLLVQPNSREASHPGSQEPQGAHVGNSNDQKPELVSTPQQPGGLDEGQQHEVVGDSSEDEGPRGVYTTKFLQDAADDHRCPLFVNIMACREYKKDPQLLSGDGPATVEKASQPRQYSQKVNACQSGGKAVTDREVEDSEHPGDERPQDNEQQDTEQQQGEPGRQQQQQEEEQEEEEEEGHLDAFDRWFICQYEHTFLKWHSTWQQAHEAAVADYKEWWDKMGAKDVLEFESNGEIETLFWEDCKPEFASAMCNTQLFPHGYVSEEDHKLLKLMHDIKEAATQLWPRPHGTQPSETSTTGQHAAHSHWLLAGAAQVQALKSLWKLRRIMQGSSGWRDAEFIMRWSIMMPYTTESTTRKPPKFSLGDKPIDGQMHAHQDYFALFLDLPMALLTLAVTGNEQVTDQAAAVLNLLDPLSEYGFFPWEEGKVDRDSTQGKLDRLHLALLLVRSSSTITVGTKTGDHTPIRLQDTEFVKAYLLQQWRQYGAIRLFYRWLLTLLPGSDAAAGGTAVAIAAPVIAATVQTAAMPALSAKQAAVTTSTDAPMEQELSAKTKADAEVTAVSCPVATVDPVGTKVAPHIVPQRCDVASSSISATVSTATESGRVCDAMRQQQQQQEGQVGPSSTAMPRPRTRAWVAAEKVAAAAAAAAASATAAAAV